MAGKAFEMELNQFKVVKWVTLDFQITCINTCNPGILIIEKI